MFLNTIENVINRRVDIPEDIRRFQNVLQYARSKVDYVIGEFIYMLPSDMNLRIGKIKTYNNKILVSSPSFKIGTNLKINLDGEKDKPDVKPKNEPDIKSNKEQKQDTKPNIEFKIEDKQDVKTELGMDKITYEEEKVALVLGNNINLYSMVDVQMTYLLLVFVMKYVYNKMPTPVISANKFLDNHPITSFALFKIHEIIEPMIPGKDANALSANLPNNHDRAFNLSFIHSLAPPFLSPPLVLPNVVVDTLGPPS